jgi:hypothetical protein
MMAMLAGVSGLGGGGERGCDGTVDVDIGRADSTRQSKRELRGLRTPLEFVATGLLGPTINGWSLSAHGGQKER